MRIGSMPSPNIAPSAGPGAPAPVGSEGVSATDPIEGMTRGDRARLESSRMRRQEMDAERAEYNSLRGMLDGLGESVGKLRSPDTFSALKVESSHPDIVQGNVSGVAKPGKYEFEVRGLAQPQRQADVGFPDAHETPVGFGYMAIEGADGKESEITIEPGSTLTDVARTINDTNSDVYAQVVNTGMGDDPFRLMVSSKTTGQPARFAIDEDTTYLQMQDIKQARDLDMVFEDMPVARQQNTVGDLLEGVNLDVKRAEPGTKVSVSVGHDIDKTLEGIKGFAEKYNQIAQYANDSFTFDPNQPNATRMSNGSNLRSVMRRLQDATGKRVDGQQYGSLSEIGISTNAKNGQLMIDEEKVKKALADNYDDVVAIFARSEKGDGLATQLHDAIKVFKDPTSGAIGQRMRTLDKSIQEQDRNIERQTVALDEKRAVLKQQFSNLNQKMAGLEAQGQFLGARFAGSPS